jgi:hypothetical protein
LVQEWAKERNLVPSEIADRKLTDDHLMGEQEVVFEKTDQSVIG